jgi:GR25 family glycosyltransferase involved in LPS biosynthesis
MTDIPFLPEDDPVLNGYITKYKLSDPDTYAIIFDKDSTSYINSTALSAMATIVHRFIFQDKVNVKLNLVVIMTGTGYQTLDASDFNHEIVNLQVTHLSDRDLAVQLMSVCGNHILSRSKLSDLCAKLPFKVKEVNEVKDNCKRQLYIPTPIMDGASYEYGFGINLPVDSTQFFDRIYYINLDRRPDRRKHMEEQLEKFKLSAVRVDAVDGSKLEWKDNVYGGKSTYWNNGALGYCLSYRLALVDAIKHNFKRILVLDDDCILSDNMYDILEKAFKQLPEDWHMLYLAANHSNESMPTASDRVNDNVYRLKGSVGSHAIIINNLAFETILNYVSCPYSSLDVFFAVYQKICPCYITYPGLARQLPGHSDIINMDVNYNRDIDYINHIKHLNL